MLRQQKKRLNVPIEVLSYCAHRLSFSDQSIESSRTSSAWGATISFARVQRNIILTRVCPSVESQFPPSEIGRASSRARVGPYDESSVVVVATQTKIKNTHKKKI